LLYNEKHTAEKNNSKFALFMKILQRSDLFFLVKAFLPVFLFLTDARAQMIKELSWTAAYSRPEVLAGEEVEVILKAKISDGFYIYSNDFDPDLGPQLTEIELEKHPSYRVSGKLAGVGAKKKYDEVWEGDVSVFTGVAEFRLKVEILSENPVIKGVLYYQMCNDETCVSFSPSISLPPLKVKAGPERTKSTAVPEEAPPAKDSTVSDAAPASPAPEKMEDKPAPPAEEVSGDDIRGKSLLGLFLLGFAAGFLAILTPCVFPMIPMTVAFFTKKNDKAKGRKMALFYGLSIVVIYTGIGVLLSAFFGATFGYAISTHWFPNILFFTIFMIFGFSFLGAFELVLPSSFVNSIDKKSDKGGYIGVFFIALTLVVISFSCTVPVVGSVAILAENGELIRPLAAMLGFSISFALPFTLFAFFPQWMGRLPRSGGWLNSVKVVFGFAEVALALKFFSQADLAYHWGILDRDVFLSFWIVLSFLLGLYLIGKLKFSHDSDLPFISVPRFFLALLAFSFSIYMIPGLWGAPLKPLAGILPPLSSQDWPDKRQTYQELESIGNPPAFSQDTVKYANMLHLPQGLYGFYDYRQGLNAVKKLNKPALLDFTGHSCANCRKMEENVWPVPEVYSRLQNDVIIVSLYADEKLLLPEDEWYVSERDGRVKKTLGDQNLDLEISRYGENAQPMYFIVDGEGHVLSKFNGYKNDPVAFAEFIDKGVARFRELQKGQP
jgi:thiol:disulfide interchange protein